MLFRKEKFDGIKLLAAQYDDALNFKIQDFVKDKIVVDLQFSSVKDGAFITHFVLILYRFKHKLISKV